MFWEVKTRILIFGLKRNKETKETSLSVGIAKIAVGGWLHRGEKPSGPCDRLFNLLTY